MLNDNVVRSVVYPGEGNMIDKDIDPKFALNFAAFHALPTYLNKTGVLAPPPLTPPGPEARGILARCIGVPSISEAGPVKVTADWRDNGVRIRILRWEMPYGPPSEAYLLFPAIGTGPWPGVLALHAFAVDRSLGKKSDVRGAIRPESQPTGTPSSGLRGWPVEVAKAGFCVLVSDSFAWGSRQPFQGNRSEPEQKTDRKSAEAFEEDLSRWAPLAGTSLPGLILADDLVSVGVLRKLPECAGRKLACVGYSFGGVRAMYLAGLDTRLNAAAISCLLTSTVAAARLRLWRQIVRLVPPGWQVYGDFPDIAAASGVPLFAQYALQDPLFTEEGMRSADRRLKALYETAGFQDRYTGEFHELGHGFAPPMRNQVISWLRERLA